MATPQTFPPLTAGQRRFIQHLTEQPHLTSRELCDRAHVSLTSYYVWCHDPRFRALLTALWSQPFLFNGWQVVNRTLQLIDQSPVYVRFLFQLLFDPKGQSALASWQSLASGSVLPTLGMRTPAPARIARHLAKVTAQGSRKPVPPVQAPAEQNQQLTPENCRNPLAATARGADQRQASGRSPG